jgi:SNF2 family DNA or RNA helicase
MKIKLRDYQRKGILHLVNHPNACLFEDPGLGKTIQTLLAFILLRRADAAEKMLIVGPLSVVQAVWQAEGAKWAETQHLSMQLLHGPNKAQRLRQKVDIHLINYEGLAWLEKELKRTGREWPWDIVVWDELTKCKNVGTVRARWILRNYHRFDRHWGLTGTPMSTQGFIDLFGQLRTIDGGKALGTTKDQYINLFFYLQSPFDREYTIKPGAAEVITERISPIVYQLKAEDHLDMPERITTHHDIRMSDEHWSLYNDLERQMAVEWQGKDVTVASAGVLWNKLLQVIQGFSYTDCKETIWHNQDKMDHLETIIEGANGNPVLVFCKYIVEGIALQARFPESTLMTRHNTTACVDAFNANRIPVLITNPLTAGHGLNLQLGGAHIIVWYCQESSPEIYAQANGRLYRQGQKNRTVIIHHLNMTHPDGRTVDDDIIAMLENRMTVQEAVVKRLASLQQQRMQQGSGAAS